MARAGGPAHAPAAQPVVFTPAQDLGFFARSSSWRCTACGKVHTFAEQVPVVAASPCVCTGIEFEPQRDGLFKPAEMLAGEAPPLLT